MWRQRFLARRDEAKAMAERMLGVGQREPNMIYLDYGTGIGAGVIVDGKLLYGHNCGVGEVGHTNMVRSGPTCKCGSNGCLEAVAGAGAVDWLGVPKGVSDCCGHKGKVVNARSMPDQHFLLIVIILSSHRLLGRSFAFCPLRAGICLRS